MTSSLQSTQADMLIAEAERVEEVQAKEYQREKTSTIRFLASSEFDGERFYQSKYH